MRGDAGRRCPSDLSRPLRRARLREGLPATREEDHHRRRAGRDPRPARPTPRGHREGPERLCSSERRHGSAEAGQGAGGRSRRRPGTHREAALLRPPLHLRRAPRHRRAGRAGTRHRHRGCRHRRGAAPGVSARRIRCPGRGLFQHRRHRRPRNRAAGGRAPPGNGAERPGRARRARKVPALRVHRSGGDRGRRRPAHPRCRVPVRRRVGPRGSDDGHPLGQRSRPLPRSADRRRTVPRGASDLRSEPLPHHGVPRNPRPLGPRRLRARARRSRSSSSPQPSKPAPSRRGTSSTARMAAIGFPAS